MTWPKQCARYCTIFFSCCCIQEHLTPLSGQLLGLSREIGPLLGPLQLRLVLPELPCVCFAQLERMEVVITFLPRLVKMVSFAHKGENCLSLSLCLVRAALLSVFPHQRVSSCSPSCQSPAYGLVGHISMWRTHQLLREAGDLSRGARCRVGKTSPPFPRAADIWRKAITLAALPPCCLCFISGGRPPLSELQELT